MKIRNLEPVLNIFSDFNQQVEYLQLARRGSSVKMFSKIKSTFSKSLSYFRQKL